MSEKGKMLVDTGCSQHLLNKPYLFTGKVRRPSSITFVGSASDGRVSAVGRASVIVGDACGEDCVFTFGEAIYSRDANSNLLSASQIQHSKSALCDTTSNESPSSIKTLLHIDHCSPPHCWPCCGFCVYLCVTCLRC